MGEYSECPNCVQDQLIVPLRTEGKSMVCPYYVNQNIDLDQKRFSLREIRRDKTTHDEI